ncbi:glycosyltransferase family protein [Sphingobacterium cellulitidis]|uniref:Uncharacterized protein n=1 Tax=Sphingobacterium cellulitidis TaxID=1768011 RepID=A0A8H9KVZ8_9SPHI|nr:hypothetical protein [Sphingobacterium soli]MBA8987574.1 hypothetical protein [Sphingobacterium soli]GGE23866.1 hypothetical protein GCM10011516_21930 [Sphingobacterium soli]
MIKAWHVIKSPSFRTDGRLQKWVKQLRKRGIQSEVFIVEDKNEKSIQIEDDTTINKSSLVFRKLFKQRRGYFFKIPEYLIITNRNISDFDGEVIVFHDVQQYLNIYWKLFFNKKRKFKIIWDLHELPHSILLKNKYLKFILEYIISNVDAVVYTNVERRSFILNNLPKVVERKYFILNNFPDKDFLISDNEPLNLLGFTNQKPYFLWLGAGIETRNFGVFLKAYQKFKGNYNLIIIGKIDPLFERDIDSLKVEKVVFNDFVDQNEIKKFIDNSFLSVVLYKNNSTNNLLCEPNRLYQLLGRKIPVVVGNNPTMASLVNTLGVGNVLEDDGQDLQNMIETIQKVIDSRSEILENYSRLNFIEKFSWEDQINGIIDFILE